MTALVIAGLLGSGAARPQGAAVSERDRAAVTAVSGTASQEGMETGRTRTGSSPAVPESRSETCRSAKNAVRFYESRRRYWRTRAGAGKGLHPSAEGRGTSCASVRLLAKHSRDRAHAARLAYLAWWHEQYAWWDWMPDKFRRVGHCETGSTPGGTPAGNFHWDSGRYVSAFGIYRPGYEAYHRWTGSNTPREQYLVAAAIQARFGWGAWGCGGA